MNNILLVENEQVIIDAAKRILTPEGFNVDVTSDAEIAFYKFQQNEYKLIISDLMLPNISGIELIEKVKRTNTRIPIIIITGYAMLENAVKSFKTGAFDFIPKPFDIEELLGVVYRALNHVEISRRSAVEEKSVQPYGEGKYYYLGRHSWAKLDEDGIIVFGLGDTFPGRMGVIQRVEFPFINTEVWQGNLCVRIISREQLIHMVWAPLSGKVVEINHEIEKNVDLINADPGWLIKIIPTNLERELENLTDNL